MKRRKCQLLFIFFRIHLEIGFFRVYNHNIKLHKGKKMEKNINNEFISGAVKFGIEKKFGIADLAFEGADGNLTEEMKRIAEEKKVDTIFSFESEVVEMCEHLKGVPVIAKGNIFSRGLFGWNDCYSENMTALFYAHKNGIQLLSTSHFDIEPEIVLDHIYNADRFLDNDGENYEKKVEEVTQCQA